MTPSRIVLPRGSSLRLWITLALLAASLLIAYSNSFQGGFAGDSRTLILKDPRIQAVNPANLKRIVQENYWWPNAQGGVYRPVTTLSYLGNYAVLGSQDNAWGYHCVNFLLHLLNTLLAFLLVRRLSGDASLALMTSAIWALHPVCTEAVTNVVGRADELAAAAVFGSLLLYIRSSLTTGWRKLGWLAALMLVAAIGLFSKENTVAIAALLPLYDITYRVPPLTAGPRSMIARIVRHSAGYLALAPPLLVFLYARSVLTRQPIPMNLPFVDNPIAGAGFWTGKLTAIKVIGKYLWILLWPRNLSCDYSFNSVPLVSWPFRGWEDWQVVLALAAVAALFYLALASYRRNGTACFFIGFSALALLPTANLLGSIGTIMADRFLYLPALGFAGCVAMGIHAARGKLRLPAWTPAVATCLLAVALGSRTYLRNPAWSSNEILWAEALRIVPGSFKPHLAIAEAWFEGNREGRLDQIIAEAEKSAEIVSPLPDRLNIALVYQKLGSYYIEKGDSLSSRANGEILPTATGKTWYWKARAVLERGVAIDREANAAARAKMARSKDPDSIPIFGLGQLYATLGKTYLRLDAFTEAQKAFRHQRQIDVEAAAPYRELAAVSLKTGNRQDALIALLESLILDPSHAVLTPILQLYDLMAPQSCATFVHGRQEYLNTGCPLVRHHVCLAYRELAKADLEAKNMFAFERIRQAALHDECSITP